MQVFDGNGIAQGQAGYTNPLLNLTDEIVEIEGVSTKELNGQQVRGNVSIYVSIYVSISIYLSIYLSLSIYIYLSLSIYLSIYHSLFDSL